MHLLKHWPGRRKIVCVLKEFGLFMEQRLHITKANCAKAAGVVWKISPPHLGKVRFHQSPVLSLRFCVPSHVSKIRPVCLGVKQYLAGNSKVTASNRCDRHINFLLNPKGVKTRWNEVVKGYGALGLAILTP